MKGFPTSLSKDVLATVNGYERREVDGELVKYYIKADKATTFADNHQELETVYMQVFDDTGQASDTITAAKAVYVPEENKNFTAYLAGSVDINTRDSLHVKTEQVTYKKADGLATADEEVEFDRENVKGKSFGALVHTNEKKIELLRDVEIDTAGSSELEKSGISAAKIKAGYASYDQGAERIDLHDSVSVNVRSKGKGGLSDADVTADRATVFLAAKDGNTRDLSKLELFDNVHIVSRQTDGAVTNINSGYAMYSKDADRFDLDRGSEITTTRDEKPTKITAQAITYEQTSGKVAMVGNAQITQLADLIKGDRIDAVLNAAKQLQHGNVRGNSYLRQTSADRVVEVAGGEIDSAFGSDQQLTEAHVRNAARAVITPVSAAEYKAVTILAPQAINVLFKEAGLMREINTQGRTTVQLDVPDDRADAASKRVTADTVKILFGADGKSMQKAEAVGKAELYIEPLHASAENYKTTINAPRFDCDFFPTGNNAKACSGGDKTKTVRVPTLPGATRGTQTLTAEKLLAVFDQGSKDVQSLNASGNAKFTELDRNALANELTFTTADGVLRLRGGEPTAWDSTARVKATEIDWDTKKAHSFMRGAVSTTYYSQKDGASATPFGSTDKPVFITSDSAEFDHTEQHGAFTGNARAWQENNYIRGDRIDLYQQDSRFTAVGNVQSLLYDAKRKENGREMKSPVFAASKRMAYSKKDRLIRYEEAVDIRQGTDRITGDAANVYLDEKNELQRTDIEKNVVITQPKRRAVGDYAQYVASEDSVLIRGNPARVEDAENGNSQAGEIKVFLRDKRVQSEGKTASDGTSRTRSVYKVKTN